MTPNRTTHQISIGPSQTQLWDSGALNRKRILLGRLARKVDHLRGLLIGKLAHEGLTSNDGRELGREPDGPFVVANVDDWQGIGLEFPAMLLHEVLLHRLLLLDTSLGVVKLESHLASILHAQAVDGPGAHDRLAVLVLKIVVRNTNMAKIGLKPEVVEIGLVISWIPQLKVVANRVRQISLSAHLVSATHPIKPGSGARGSSEVHRTRPKITGIWKSLTCRRPWCKRSSCTASSRHSASQRYNTP